MILKELSTELNVGRLHVRPLDRAARLIIPCDSCGEFSPKRVIVSCGHIFCHSCCTTWQTPDGPRFHCISCNKKSTGEVNELADAVLAQLKFACCCGRFEGTLGEIRGHAWNNDTGHNRVREELRSQPGLVREENLVNILREELRVLRMLDNSSRQGRTKAYFCIELQSRIDAHANTKSSQRTREVEWTGAGYPLKFYCKIELWNEKPYLGVYIRILNERPSLSSWPMKKNIIFELYNQKGESVRSSSFVTYENGKPTDEKFTSACKPTDGCGFARFCPINELTATGANILCNGHVCISTEFRELND